MQKDEQLLALDRDLNRFKQLLSMTTDETERAKLRQRLREREGWREIIEAGQPIPAPQR
jgi:hypothetical protein